MKLQSFRVHYVKSKNDGLLSQFQDAHAKNPCVHSTKQIVQIFPPWSEAEVNNSILWNRQLNSLKINHADGTEVHDRCYLLSVIFNELAASPDGVIAQLKESNVILLMEGSNSICKY